MDRSVACRVLFDFHEIDPLANEWRDLQARAGVCPFTCYDWLFGWWQTMGLPGGRSLHIVIATREGKLAGVLPLSIRKKYGVRILEWAGNDLFDYCSTLAEDDDVANELWQAARKSSHYDMALIKDIRPASREFVLLSEFAKKIDNAKAPYIALEWPSSQAWLKSRERKMRRDISYKTQRLEQHGPIALEVLRNGPVPAGIITTMIRLKRNWCSVNGKKGIFSNGLTIPAFQRMADIAAEQGKLFLAILKSGGTPVSYIFGFIDGKTLYCYFTCYDPAWSACSPGTLIFAHTIGWAIDNGLKEYDFMRGIESFKLRFATGLRDLPTFLSARTPLGYAVALCYWISFHINKIAKKTAKRLPARAQKRLLSLRRKPDFVTETI